MKPVPLHKCIDRGSFSDPSVRGEIWSSSSIFILNFGVFRGCGRSAVGVSALSVSDVVEAQFIAQIILECVKGSFGQSDICFSYNSFSQLSGSETAELSR